MRKRTWSVATVAVLSAILGPTVQAADEVTMGSQSEPNAFRFFPADISVPVGSTVTWRNLSDLQHDVKAVDNAFGSPLLDKGQTFAYKFDAPGPVTYYCSVSGHREAGMEATVNVTGGSATTPTTQAPAPGPSTTTTTAKGAPVPSTTTTTRPAAGAPAGPTTTTTAGLGVTSTTQAASTTPTSAPETGDVTSTTTMAGGTDGHGGGESAADTHGNEGDSDKKTNPVAVGLAGILTAVLAAISLKLLTGKP